MTSIFAGSDENGPRNRNKNHGFLGSFSYIYIVLFSLFLDPTKEENSSILFLVLFLLVPIFPL